MDQLALKAKRLAGIDLFAGLDEPDVLQAVAAEVEFRLCHRGEVLFEEGEPGEHIHFVVSGRVKVYRRSADGTEHILRIWREGEAFALIVLLDPSRYPASAEALEDSVVGRMRAATFHRLSQQHRSLQSLGQRAVADRLVYAQRKAEQMARDPGEQRVARALLELVGDTAGGAVSIALTHHDLAYMTGLSRETVSRIVAGLRQQGAVGSPEAGRLVVHPARLRALLSESDRMERS